MRAVIYDWSKRYVRLPSANVWVDGKRIQKVERIDTDRMDMCHFAYDNDEVLIRSFDGSLIRRYITFRKVLIEWNDHTKRVFAWTTNADLESGGKKPTPNQKPLTSLTGRRIILD